MLLDEGQWQHFSLDGFLSLGRVITSAEVQALRERADELAAGTLRNELLLIDLDVADTAEGSTRYRDIQGLEHDDRFRALVDNVVFVEACGRIYAPHAPISILPAMIDCDPPGSVGEHSWHQDGGADWELDRDPLLTVWVALDDATLESGCLEVVRGSHHRGLVARQTGTLSPAEVQEHCDPAAVVALEVQSGHAVLMHSWLIRRYGPNRSGAPRRAFTACYLDGRTISVATGGFFPVIHGELDTAPHPYVRQLVADRTTLERRAREAEERVATLEAELGALREASGSKELALRPQAESENGAEGANGSSARVSGPRRAANWLRSLLH